MVKRYRYDAGHGHVSSDTGDWVLHSDFLASEQRNKELLQAVETFIAAHDACVKESAWVWHFVANHGCEYKGPNYKAELEALKQAALQPTLENEPC